MERNTCWKNSKSCQSVKTMPAHLTQPQRVRALSLLEAGISQGEVAKRLQVSRWTIARLQKIKVIDPSQVERRKAGTGLKNKKYGSKEVNAIKRLLDKNSFLTSFQIKLMLKKTLQNIFPWCDQCQVLHVPAGVVVD